VTVRDTIAKARADGHAALIGYLPVGFPDTATSIAAMRAMVAAGVDIVEVGLPYSDPLIDGPVIQRASEIALAGGTRTADVLAAVAAVVDAGSPALVMTYWNLIDHYGVERFAADLAGAGGSGLITPDLLPDDAADWHRASDAHGLDRVYLVAPSSTAERIALTADASRGFVYAASLMGVTGVRGALSADARSLVERVRAVTDLPVCVGLGVSSGAQAAEVAGFADGVIVGSALVRAIFDASDGRAAVAAVAAVAAELAEGVRATACPAVSES
jgi:tryptophan synthase alpha chain